MVGAAKSSVGLVGLQSVLNKDMTLSWRVLLRKTVLEGLVLISTRLR